MDIDVLVHDLTYSVIRINNDVIAAFFRSKKLQNRYGKSI